MSDKILRAIEQDLEEEIENAGRCIKAGNLLVTREYLKGLLQARAIVRFHQGKEDADDDERVIAWEALAESLRPAAEKAKAIRKLNEALKELGVLAK